MVSARARLTTFTNTNIHLIQNQTIEGGTAKAFNERTERFI